MRAAEPFMGLVLLHGSAILVAGLLVACGPHPSAVTLQSLHATRARWEARSVRSYHIIIDVERPGDRRRNEITVLDDTIVRSSVAYWDRRRGDWGPPRELTVEQASPFTVPGLYALIRREVMEGHRSDCRVAFVGDPPVPERILLGPMTRSGEPVLGTEATIIVRSFEPRLPAPAR